MAFSFPTAAASLIKEVAEKIVYKNQNINLRQLIHQISIKIIENKLGRVWLEKHVLANRPATEFFVGSSSIISSTKKSDAYFWRVSSLAELLINLEKVQGVEEIIKRIKKADGAALAGAYVELDVGRVMYQQNLDFKFVVRKNQTKHDYDYEILHNDQLYYAETKTKLDSTNPSDVTIIEAIKKARDQLPSDTPGIIFFNVPHGWIRDDDPEFSFNLINPVIDNFFSMKEGEEDFTHVAAVVLWYNFLSTMHGFVQAQQYSVARPNPNRKFSENVNGFIFNNQNDHPANWLSLNLILRNIVKNNPTRASVEIEERYRKYVREKLVNGSIIPLYSMSFRIAYKKKKKFGFNVQEQFIAKSFITYM